MSLGLARLMWTTLPLFGVIPITVKPLFFPRDGYRIIIANDIYIDVPIGRHMSLWIAGKKKKITIFEKSLRKNTDLIKKCLLKREKDKWKITTQQISHSVLT